MLFSDDLLNNWIDKIYNELESDLKNIDANIVLNNISLLNDIYVMDILILKKNNVKIIKKKKNL